MAKISKKDFIEIMKDTIYVKEKETKGMKTYDIDYAQILNSISGWETTMAQESISHYIREKGLNEGKRIMDEITERIPDFYK